MVGITEEVVAKAMFAKALMLGLRHLSIVQSFCCLGGLGSAPLKDCGD